jgi:hypothetical protein
MNTTQLLIIVNSPIDYSTFSGTLVFGSNVYDIASVANFQTSTVLVTCFTTHNFTPSSVGDTVTLYNTVSRPDFNGGYQIYGVLSDTQFILPGSVLPGGDTNVSVIGTGGSFPRHDVLKSKVISITDIVPGAFTLFTAPNHNLQVGDSVKFYNVNTTPSLLVVNSGVFRIHSIPDNNTFTIDFASTSYNPESITSGSAMAGTREVSVSFPYHGFNKVVHIANGFTPKTISGVIDNSNGINPSVIVTTTTPHGLVDGDVITLSGTNTQPVIDASGYTVTYVNATSFQIPVLQGITSSGTSGQVNVSNMRVRVTTQLPHGFVNGDSVRLMQTDSVPSIDGGGYTVTVVALDVFDIVFRQGVTTPGTTGIIGMNHKFVLYSVSEVGGLVPEVLNNKSYTVREIVDANNFTFLCDDFATSTERGGGVGIYINSLLHGFNGIQTNTKNDLLNRSINLQGENYAFLCCPQLATMMNTGNVKNVFARITLDQSPGSMVFAFLSNPKEFDVVPLDKLSELEFSIVNYDGTLYSFNDLDFSCTLEITEVQDTTEGFNISSKRGVTNL